jgi:hypothetical protein
MVFILLGKFTSRLYMTEEFCSFDQKTFFENKYFSAKIADGISMSRRSKPSSSLSSSFLPYSGKGDFSR